MGEGGGEQFVHKKMEYDRMKSMFISIGESAGYRTGL